MVPLGDRGLTSRRFILGVFFENSMFTKWLAGLCSGNYAAHSTRLYVSVVIIK